MTRAQPANEAGSMQLEARDALLIVDVQNDFLPGGALAVPDADSIVPILNRYIELFSQRHLPIIATRDWHPANHSSFAANGGVWPEHCVQNTFGAEFSAQLALPADALVIDKGCAVDGAGYSGFEQPQLQNALQSLRCRRLFIAGLATDYCVLQTAIAACRIGYAVVLLTDAMRAVDVHAGDGERALAQLQQLGAIPMTLAAFHSGDSISTDIHINR